MLRRVLKAIWGSWNVIARKVGNFQARVLISLFYYLVFAPFALGVKMFFDPLRLHPDSALGWLKCIQMEGNPMMKAGRQF